MNARILVIGASGQIGIELVKKLRAIHGDAQVIASDLRCPEIYAHDPYFKQLDVLDKDKLSNMVVNENINTIYLLAAMLSAVGEKHPQKAWHLNMQSLLHILDLGKDKKVSKIFWPSSIAVFGSESPKFNTPQHCIKNPNTVYGISKLAGEQWCAYYHEKYGVDVRSIRYPGLIGHESEPGGGTTDYAVAIFHEAIENGHYTSYLAPDRSLPMMYMPDAIRATIEMMDADESKLRVRDSYNLAGISFSPKQIATEIQNHFPHFTMNYAPDFRDDIAKSWPSSIDDSTAQEEWGWSMEFDLKSIVKDMLNNLSHKKGASEMVS